MARSTRWAGISVVVLIAAAAGCTPQPSSAIVGVGGGARFSCVSYANGQVWCWGADEVGELGRGSIGPSTATAAAVAGLPAVASISSGIGDHECAVVTGGAVYCWGSNSNDQLGTIFFPYDATPGKVGGLPPASQVATGKTHTCAVLSSGGGVDCWGSNTYGELGNDSTTMSAAPVPVVGMSGAVEVTAGDEFSCAMKTDFTVWCWGEGNDGQLGDGTSGAGTMSTTPVEVLDTASASGFGQPLSGVTWISAGSAHVCAVHAWPSTGGDAAVWCWGENSSGQLGDGTITSSNIATPAVGLYQTASQGVSSVQAGWYHTCADVVDKTMSTSSVECWGNTPGDGQPAGVQLPTAVAPLTGVKSIGGFGAGFDHTCTLVTGGPGVHPGSTLAYCWGRDSDDELGVVGPSTPVPQVVSGLPLLL